MSTQNDRAILNSIINPIQPVDEAELFTTIEDDSREGMRFKEFHFDVIYTNFYSFSCFQTVQMLKKQKNLKSKEWPLLNRGI